MKAILMFAPASALYLTVRLGLGEPVGTALGFAGAVMFLMMWAEDMFGPKP